MPHIDVATKFERSFDWQNKDNFAWNSGTSEVSRESYFKMYSPTIIFKDKRIVSFILVNTTLKIAVMSLFTIIRNASTLLTNSTLSQKFSDYSVLNSHSKIQPRANAIKEVVLQSGIC